MKLTPKQERFAQVYVQTGNASEAFRQAYDASKTKPEVVNVKGSQILANGNVMVRVKQLQDELAKRELWTREDSVNVLKAIAKGEDPEVRPTDKVNAVKALNAMHGWDKQTIDLTNSDGSLAPTRIELVAQHDHSQD